MLAGQTMLALGPARWLSIRICTICYTVRKEKMEAKQQRQQCPIVPRVHLRMWVFWLILRIPMLQGILVSLGNQEEVLLDMKILILLPGLIQMRTARSISIWYGAIPTAGCASWILTVKKLLSKIRMAMVSLSRKMISGGRTPEPLKWFQQMAQIPMTWWILQRLLICIADRMKMENIMDSIIYFLLPIGVRRWDIQLLIS